MSEFDPINFLSQAKQIETGSNLSTAADGGFLRDTDVTQSFITRTATYSSTTGITTNAVAYALLASTGASTFGPFQVPRAYDQTSDQLQLRILGSTAGTGSSTIDVLGLVTVYSTGATAGVASLVSQASTTVGNGAFSNIGWAIQGANLQYPDAFTITLSTSGGNYQVYTAALVISDCLVGWADPGTAPQSGNPPVQSTGYELVGTNVQQIRTA